MVEYTCLSVESWYMTSEWIKEKYETRSDITILGIQKI